MFGLTLGIIVFTSVFLADVGMQFPIYKSWLTILLSVTTLISNAAIAYYFHKGKRTRPTVRRAPQKTTADQS